MQDETHGASRVSRQTDDQAARSGDSNGSEALNPIRRKPTLNTYIAEDDISLSELFGILLLYPLTILTVTIAMVFLGVTLANNQTTVYSAEAVLRVSADADIDPNALQDQVAPAALHHGAYRMAVLVGINETQRKRLEAANAQALAAEVVKRTSDAVWISSDTSQNKIRVAAKSAEPDKAISLANAISQALVDMSSTSALPASGSDAPEASKSSWLTARITELELDIDRRTFALERLQAQSDPSTLRGAQTGAPAGAPTDKALDIEAAEKEIADAASRLKTYREMLAEVIAGSDMIEPDLHIASVASDVRSSSGSWFLGLVSVFALLGLATGCGIALLRHLFDDRLNNALDVANKVGVQSVSVIPELDHVLAEKLPPDERSPEGFVVNYPLSDFTESFRLVLSSAISASKHPDKCLVVAVSSTSHGDGKTTVCRSLARAAEMIGKRVLVIDASLDDPSISQSIQIAGKPGLAAALLDLGILHHAIVEKPEGYEDFIPLSPEENALIEDAFLPEKLGRLFDILRKSYDLILVDCPPVMSSLQAQIMTGVCDNTILVSRRGRTAARSLQLAISASQNAGGSPPRILLNFSTS